jgi:hypothetical protein
MSSNTENGPRFLPPDPNIIRSPETDNRIVILGSRVNTDFTLKPSGDLNTYLKQNGISEPAFKVCRDASRIEEVIVGKKKSPDEVSQNPNLPKGVILLGKMKQFKRDGDLSIRADEIDVSADVENLCAKYGIPLVIIPTYTSPAHIEGGLKSILEYRQAKSPPSVPPLSKVYTTNIAI